jgi:hypothetical protein
VVYEAFVEFVILIIIRVQLGFVFHIIFKARRIIFLVFVIFVCHVVPSAHNAPSSAPDKRLHEHAQEF